MNGKEEIKQRDQQCDKGTENLCSTLFYSNIIRGITSAGDTHTLARAGEKGRSHPICNLIHHITEAVQIQRTDDKYEREQREREKVRDGIQSNDIDGKTTNSTHVIHV